MEQSFEPLDYHRKEGEILFPDAYVADTGARLANYLLDRVALYAYYFLFGLLFGDLF